MEQQQKSVLVVDDELFNRDMLARRLTKAGFRVETAPDGPSALAALDRHTFELVLLDQMMPGMTGVDLLKLLRASHSPSELPVIMVTALADSSNVVEAFGSGANDYITKPIDFPVALARIQAQIERHAADRALRASQEACRLTDPVTGLPNRARFLELLAERLAAFHAGKLPAFALICLDLDRFKVINDSLGPAAGDELIAEVARRLSTAVRTNLGGRIRDTVARMGGDEFVVLLADLAEPAQAEQVALRLQQEIQEPLAVAGRELYLSASIGIAVAERTHRDASMLLRDADTAMYHAKEAGKARVATFNEPMRARALERLELESDLQHALARNEMRVFYQPKVNLADGSVAGFEALVRWMHPTRGLITPASFIPVAEETGLIVPIGEWVLREAMATMCGWQRSFPRVPPLEISVNLSVRQFRQPNLVERIAQMVSQSGLEPGTLHLEVTESILIQDVETAGAIFQGLKSIGVGLKVDDFGTGYSSLQYLTRLPFDSLKIDRSFVNKMCDDPHAMDVVRTIIDLASRLQMQVIAEGIETEEQLTRLQSVGCGYGQGYYFCRPLPEAEASAFAARLPEAAASPAG